MRLLATGRAVRQAQHARFVAILSRTATQRSWHATATKHGTRPVQNNQDTEPSTESVPSSKTNRESIVIDDGLFPAEGHGSEGDSRKNGAEEKQDNTIFTRPPRGAMIAGKPYTFDSKTNLSSSILSHVDRRLYLQPNHPICITRKLIESVFAGPKFQNHVAPDPVVTVEDNFDDLGFPTDHPGRSSADTYYVNEKHVLRTHTSAHQLRAFKRLAGKEPWLTDGIDPDRPTGYTICADVFRRDSIDRSHFPVFHQMEGAKLWSHRVAHDSPPHPYYLWIGRKNRLLKDLDSLPPHHLTVFDRSVINEENPIQIDHNHQEARIAGQHLKRSLQGLIASVFHAARQAGIAAGDASAQQPLKVRWINAYFPFTSPSWELEVFWQGEWLEILGCGIIKHELLEKADCADKIGWAWGIGIERLAMLLFGIPDIRLFWSQDERFLSQFKEGTITKYQPFSRYPECYKDVAFWIDASPASATPLAESGARSGLAASAGGDSTKASPDETQQHAFHENDVMEIVRDVAGSLAEDVKLVDEFVHPRTGRQSLCYRINYRSLERTLTNDEVNIMHARVRAKLAGELGVEMR